MSGIFGFMGDVPDPRAALLTLAEPMRRRPLHRVEAWAAPGVGVGRIGGVLPPSRPGPLTGPGGEVVVLEGALADRGASLRAGGLGDDGPPGRGDAGDPEAVLALWRERGAGCLPLLDGEFALCLYDPERRLLVLASDRFGLHPVYVWTRGPRIAFASEAGALARFLRAVGWDDPRPDPLGIADAVVFGAAFEGRSLLEGVRSLAPGHYLLASPDGCRSFPWADPLEGGAGGPGTPDLSEAFADTWIRALRRRARDLPARVGCLLSGGMDTRAIAAGLARLEVPFVAVTFGQEGGVDLPLAEGVAAALGIPHHRLVLPDGFPEEVAREVADVTSGFGPLSLAPVANTNASVRAVADLLFSGMSGDAIFGSGTRPPAAAEATDEEVLRQVLPPLPERVRGVVLDPSLRARREFLPPSRYRAAADPRLRGLPASRRRDRYDLALRQRRRTLEGVRVRRVDTPVRTPFWDRDLVALALSLPEDQRRHQRAYLRALCLWLPEPLAAVPWSRTGLPPGAPDAARAAVEKARAEAVRWDRLKRWFGGRRRRDPRHVHDWNGALRRDPSLQAMLGDLFAPGRMEAGEWLSPRGLGGLLDAHRRGTADHGEALARAGSVELWLRRWG